MVEEAPPAVEEPAADPVAVEPAAQEPAADEQAAADPAAEEPAAEEPAADEPVAEAPASEPPTSDKPADPSVAPTLLSTSNKTGDDNNGHQGIGICHATSSDQNPYVYISNVDADSIFKQNGHDQHTKAGGTRSDVIPAFWYIKNGNKHEYTYPGNGSYYPGKNLDATGLYMLSNGCDQPPTVPECPSDDIGPSLASDHGYDPECPKPPECPVYGEVERSNGDHGYDPECPKPPECPVYGELNEADRSVAEVATWSQDERKWECPKQPEIQVDPGECITPTNLSLIHI